MKTRFLLFTFLLLITTNSVYSQSKKLSKPNPFFVAIIVSNLDSSIAWYKEKLLLEVENRNDVPQRGFKQANLKSKSMHVELLELKAVVLPSKILKYKSGKTKIAGFFKFGFSVSDIENWFNHLKSQDADFQGDMVEDKSAKKKMFIIKDPDGNRIQIFEK